MTVCKLSRHLLRSWVGPIRLRELPGQPPPPPGSPAGPDPGAAEDGAEAIPDEGPLRCAQCLWPVTFPRDRRSVGGAHRHVFANPHGLVFEIGCFARAPGCVPVGPDTPDFSWFPGTTWQVASCARCGLHLGWRYEGHPELDRFHGLILPRLRPGPGKNAPAGPWA
jgi:hypothetical protein